MLIWLICNKLGFDKGCNAAYHQPQPMHIMIVALYLEKCLVTKNKWAEPQRFSQEVPITLHMHVCIYVYMYRQH